MSYVQNTAEDRRDMLAVIGASSIEDLLEPIAPGLRVQGALRLGESLSEADVVSLCTALARKNRPATGMASFLGGGVYDRYIPAVVRYVLSRSEFYTSYTPYQAEVSQGTLQAIYEYQSLICRLTAMDAANASLYDGSTALAEAVLMSAGIRRCRRILVPEALSPRVKAVLRSYSTGKGIVIEPVPFTDEGGMDLVLLAELLGEETAAVVVAQPNYFGVIEKTADVSALAHERGALVVAYVDPVSLALLAPPGEYDADIAVGEGQSLGNPQNFGGPLLGFMAAKETYVRKCPGRLISGTVDRDGRRGYVMTLQTREQHIRRDKATSNICTNEGLCAVAAGAYLTALGESGFREVAVQSAAKAHALRALLSDLPSVRFPLAGEFFQEFVIDVRGGAGRFLEAARSRGVLAGIPLHADFPGLDRDPILVAVTERRTKAELELFRDIAALAGGGRRE